ncbi:MAG: ABC transporter substrate-binding protein [Anaerolineae bacterium]
MKLFTRRALLLQASLWTLSLGVSCRRVATPVPAPTPSPAPGITPTATPSPSSTPRPQPTQGATPAPPGKSDLIIDAVDCCWTRFAQTVTPFFEELFPTTRIVWKSITPWNDYPALVTRQTAAGNLDIVQAPIGLVLRAWARFGLIRPLDSLLMPLADTIGDIFPGAIQACTNGGKLYGVPFVASPGENLLLYNRSIFDTAGLAYPRSTWTLDDLVTTVQKLALLNAKTLPDQFGYIPHYDLPSMLCALRTFGADLITAEGTESPTVSTLLPILQWYHSNMYEHQVFPKPYELSGGPLAIFRQGKAAMIRQSFGTLVDLATPDANWLGATLWPTHRQTGVRGASISGLAHCLSGHSPQPSASIEWCKFISSTENGARMLSEGCNAPGCRISSWQESSVIRRFSVSNESAKIAMQARPEPVPWNLRQAEVYRAWKLYSESLWYDRITTQECAAGFVQACKKILELPALTSLKQLSEEAQ